MTKKTKKNNTFLYIILCIIIILLLTVFFTFPLVKNFKSTLPLSQITKEEPEKYNELFATDTLNNLYRLWLVKTQILKLKSPILDQYQNNIDGPHIEGISLWLFPLQIVSIPLSFIIGEIASYNFIYLLSYILAGLSMFLLVNFYTKNFIASLYSAIFFAFIPARILHSYGHSGALLFFIFPLTIYLLEIALNNKKWLTANIVASFFVLSAALGEWHWFIYLTALLIVFYFYKFLIIRFINKKKEYKKLIFSAIITFSGIIVGGIYLLFIQNTSLASSIAGGGRSIGEVNYYSPPIKNFVTNNIGAEKNIYLGWTNIILALFLLILLLTLPRQFRKNEKTRIWFYFILTILAMFFSLGTTINKLPVYLWLHQHIPFFDMIRVPARIKVVTTLSLSVLLGIFIAKIYEILIPLFDKNKLYKIAFYFLISIFILLNFFNLIDIRDQERNDSKTRFTVVESRTYSELNYYIKENCKDKKILYLPYYLDFEIMSTIYQYNTRQTETIMINGYTPTRPIEVKEFYEKWLKDLNQGIVKTDSLDKLKEIGVKYIALYKNIDKVSPSPFSSKLIIEKLRNDKYLENVFENNDGIIFKINEQN